MRRLFAIALLTFAAVSASARVVRLDIASRTDVGDRYEKITGRVLFAVDPNNPHNKIVTDLDKAPRDEHGEVTFTSDVVILRPKCGGNETLYLEVPNRGGIGFFADPKNDDTLFRRGYTMVWLAWQFDVRPDPTLLHFDAPIARGVRGRVRSDFIVEKPAPTYTIGNIVDASYGHEVMSQLGGIGYPVADRNGRDNVLTQRESMGAARRTIPRAKWHFTDDRTIALDGGFQPHTIYEIVYTAADPAVVGAGMAATRDFVAWAKHDPASPIPVKHALALGISQTGRFLRHFVYDGFNADENGQQVFDGVLSYVPGGGRGNFNHRFAQPSRAILTPVPYAYPVDVFPFTDLPTTDPVTGVTAGLLDRATADHVVPKIFYVNTAHEYWSRGGSLIHTTADGKSDVPFPPTSRLYFVSGTGHIDGPWPPEVAAGGQALQNPIGYYFTMHALIDAMNAWVTQGTEPPPSRYPKIADGTLVRVEDLAAKQIAFPKWAYAPVRADQSSEPPRVTGNYVTLVPQVDADGNELAGVRAPFLTVPLAAYTGWNLRAPGTGFEGDRLGFAGSMFPFTKEQIAQRYPSRDAYLGRITSATLQLMNDRYMSSEDALQLLPFAATLWDWAAARP
ncbi:MAG: hypothetical protein JO197_12755 [Acidobacteria bacterium]|nr:hypothetical protein [Acidobacteriota bacterium]MBV9478261.1 hypothetical protein [Acidobacteriota bacterium]